MTPNPLFRRFADRLRDFQQRNIDSGRYDRGTDALFFTEFMLALYDVYGTRGLLRQTPRPSQATLFL